MTAQPSARSGAPRVTVIIPCFNDGDFVEEAVCSIDETEPVQIVVIDDSSPAPGTREAIERLDRNPAVEVLRHESNRGVAATRMTGVAASTGEYLFPLDADDLLLPGSLSEMADKLDGEPESVACFGDYAEFGERNLIRTVPRRLDPFRLLYTNEYPANAMFRRAAIERLGGWSMAGSYEDWDLWMTIVENGEQTTHLGTDSLTYLHRIHAGRLGAKFRAKQAESYQRLRDNHPQLFERENELRESSDLAPSRKTLYPYVYGARVRLPGEDRLKRWMDKSGVWTLTRQVGPARYAALTKNLLAVRDLSGGSLCARRPSPDLKSPRVTVVVPCWNDGEYIRETLDSIDEREPVHVTIVDDASTDQATIAMLDDLEEEGYEVLRHTTNKGVSATRMTGIEASSTRFVISLDADDVAMPQMIELMADRLEANPQATVCYGDYAEFGERELIRAVPDQIDPFRLAYVNEYPPTALFRRDELLELGGWRRLLPEIDARSDWALWMTLAEAGVGSQYMGPTHLVYARRMHPSRLSGAGRQFHYPLYQAMRERHPKLFRNLDAYRASSPMSARRKPLYPVVYGGRRRYRFEPRLKSALDHLGIWTLRR